MTEIKGESLQVLKTAFVPLFSLFTRYTISRYLSSFFFQDSSISSSCFKDEESAREVQVRGMELTMGATETEARRARQSGRWDGERSIVPRDELKGRRGARYTSVRERRRLCSLVRRT